MGDFCASDCSWKKMVIAKTNNKWKSMVKNKPENAMDTTNFSINKDFLPISNIKQEKDADNLEQSPIFDQTEEPEEMVQVLDPLSIETSFAKQIRRKKSVPKNETEDERAARLAKMSAYAARRLANESPEQRAMRLRRMSEYAAKRLAQETGEQRARRLSRMSAYAAQRLAKESPEQRKARLARMSAYAARRQAEKKNATPELLNATNTAMAIMNNVLAHIPNQS